MSTYSKPIVATKGDERHLFRSVRQCSLYLEISHHLITQALSFGNKIQGWRIEPGEIPNDEDAIRHSDSVIGTTPKGAHVRFDSIIQAADILHCSANAIKRAVTGTNHEYGTWLWSCDDGVFETAEPTDVLCSSFCKQVKSDRKVPAPPPEDIDPYEGREVIATGVHDPEFGVTICPFCDCVVLHDAKEGDFSGYKHLTKCLEGRDWTVQLGVIKVFK